VTTHKVTLRNGGASARGAAAQRGMTLIEVVISIVIIATAVSAVLGVLSSNVGHSADALVVSQAIAIAEAYIEEVSLKPFSDPDGSDGESGRAAFDDADDYDGLVDIGAADQFGNAIAGLDGYTVSVGVVPTAALPNVASSDALRIDVRVQFAPYVDYVLSAYKTRL
jgi:MSHA pilin protein MshD